LIKSGIRKGVWDEVKVFTEAQIVFALREADNGTPIAETIRKMEIAEVTFYRLKKRYAGMGVS
jgi:putative transposase